MNALRVYLRSRLFLIRQLFSSTHIHVRGLFIVLLSCKMKRVLLFLYCHKSPLKECRGISAQPTYICIIFSITALNEVLCVYLSFECHRVWETNRVRIWMWLFHGHIWYIDTYILMQSNVITCLVKSCIMLLQEMKELLWHDRK